MQTVEDIARCSGKYPLYRLTGIDLEMEINI